MNNERERAYDMRLLDRRTDGQDTGHLIFFPGRPETENKLHFHQTRGQEHKSIDSYNL